MIDHDDALLDSIAALALGVLPEAQARPLATHIAGCERCRAAYLHDRATADAVGFIAELGPHELDEVTSARMKSRVMAAAREDARLTHIPHDTPARRAVWLPYAAAAAAIIVALSTSLNGVGQRVENERNRARIAVLETQATEQRRSAMAARDRLRDTETKLAKVIAPGSRRFAVPGGEVIAGGRHIVIALQHGPPLPPGKVYQAWTVRKHVKGVMPSITFTPDANGVAVAELPEAAANLVAVALTVEPQGGSKAPTTKPAFIRPLL